MSTMLDALYPEKIPANSLFDIGAAYVSHSSNPQSYAQMVARFPNVVHLRIAIHPNVSAEILDCETSTGTTPAMCPGWVVARRAEGIDPTVYCNENNSWAAVRAAFHSAGVAEPHYWVANYDGNPAIPSGAVAKQYTDNPQLGNPYDTSSTVAGWPTATPTPTLGDGMIELVLITDHGGEVWAMSARDLWYLDGNSLAQWQTSGLVINKTPRPITYGQFLVYQTNLTANNTAANNALAAAIVQVAQGVAAVPGATAALIPAATVDLAAVTTAAHTGAQTALSTLTLKATS